MDITNLDAVNFFIVPLSFFLVILTLLLFQGIVVSVISRNIGKISVRHPYLFRAMNWWGIFIHELSHAITALATLNKVREFKVTSNRGYVIHSSNGRGFFQWLAGQLINVSPAFVPPIIAAFILKISGYIDSHGIFQYAGPFEPVSIISTLYLRSIPYVVKTLGWLFLNLDYSRVKNILLLLIFIFSFSAAKPSSINKKYGQEGDMQILIREFFRFPAYTILFFLLGIMFFWLLFKFDFQLFSTLIIFLILLPILSLFGLIFNYIFVTIVTIFDSSNKFHIIISFLVSIIVYGIMRQYIEKQYLINTASFCVLIGFLIISHANFSKRPPS